MCRPVETATVARDRVGQPRLGFSSNGMWLAATGCLSYFLAKNMPVEVDLHWPGAAGALPRCDRDFSHALRYFNIQPGPIDDEGWILVTTQYRRPCRR